MSARNKPEAKKARRHARHSAAARWAVCPLDRRRVHAGMHMCAPCAAHLTNVIVRSARPPDAPKAERPEKAAA